MQARMWVLALAVSVVPQLLAAQTAPSSASPVADALRANARRSAQNLIAAAEEMPAERYTFAPTPAQMSFRHVVVHLAEGNDFLCGTISGVAAPQLAKVDTTDTKDKLVARLRETFEFCDSSTPSSSRSRTGPIITARPRSIYGSTACCRRRRGRGRRSCRS